MGALLDKIKLAQQQLLNAQNPDMEDPAYLPNEQLGGQGMVNLFNATNEIQPDPINIGTEPISGEPLNFMPTIGTIKPKGYWNTIPGTPGMHRFLQAEKNPNLKYSATKDNAKTLKGNTIDNVYKRMMEQDWMNTPPGTSKLNIHVRQYPDTPQELKDLLRKTRDFSDIYETAKYEQASPHSYWKNKKVANSDDTNTAKKFLEEYILKLLAQYNKGE